MKRALLLTAIAIFALYFFIWMTFPADKAGRYASHLINDQLQGALHIKIEKLQWNGAAGFYGKPVTVDLPKANFPTRIQLDQIQIKIPLLSLLMMSPNLEVLLVDDESNLRIQTSIATLQTLGRSRLGQSKPASVTIDAERLSLRRLPLSMHYLDLPIDGSIDGTLTAKFQPNQLRTLKLNGTLDFSSLALPPGPLPSIQGIQLELATPLNLGDLSMSIDSKGGAVYFKDFSQRGNPSLLIKHLQAKISPNNLLARSKVDACIAFKPTDQFKKENPKAPIHLAKTALKTDGEDFMHSPIKGSFSKVRPSRALCKTKS